MAKNDCSYEYVQHLRLQLQHGVSTGWSTQEAQNSFQLLLRVYMDRWFARVLERLYAAEMRVTWLHRNVNTRVNMNELGRTWNPERHFQVLVTGFQPPQLERNLNFTYASPDSEISSLHRPTWFKYNRKSFIPELQYPCQWTWKVREKYDIPQTSPPHAAKVASHTHQHELKPQRTTAYRDRTCLPRLLRHHQICSHHTGRRGSGPQSAC